MGENCQIIYRWTNNYLGLENFETYVFVTYMFNIFDF